MNDAAKTLQDQGKHTKIEVANFVKNIAAKSSSYINFLRVM